jgi:hypothetical protein
MIGICAPRKIAPIFGLGLENELDQDHGLQIKTGFSPPNRRFTIIASALSNDDNLNLQNTRLIDYS